MDLAALATPADHRKLEYLKRSFAAVINELDAIDMSFNARATNARAEARPILQAAARACIYDGEMDPVVRKYYAFTGDHRRVWFTLDLFTIMPDCIKNPVDRKEAVFVFKQILGLLINEVRFGLRNDLGL
jgi:hypothetical protein